MTLDLSIVPDSLVNLAEFLADHQDQITVVETAFTNAKAATTAGGVMIAFAPVADLIQSDMAAFTLAAPATRKSSVQAKLANLGANGTIITTLINAIHNAGGLAAVISSLIPVIQQIITLFPAKTT